MKKSSFENGNVIVEFIGVTVALLVPISIIAIASLSLANEYLSTEIAARTASRAFVVSSNDSSGSRAAKLAANLASQDFNTHQKVSTVRISCTKSPCLSPGGFVTVKVSKTVSLDLPDMFGSRSVVVNSQHTSIVDELRTP